MPTYTWKDELTGYEVDVLRHSFDEYRDPPTDEDLPEEERGKERKWAKMIGKGIRLTFAQGSCKGNMGNY